MPPSASGNAGPFLPWSRFTVFRAGMQKVKPLQWPARLWMSKNYFHPSWTLKTHRRLKNVICAIKWKPGTQSAVLESNGSHVHLSAEQAARVQAAFGYFDEDGDGVLSATELAAAGRAVDLHTVAQYAAAVGPEVSALRLVDLEGNSSPVVPLVQDQLASHDDGPGSFHWVLLSLLEAESLRGALHISQESMHSKLCADDDAPPPTVALHIHGQLLDGINGTATTSSDAYSHDVIQECCSFLSSATEYTIRGQHLLLRCLQANEPYARQTFFAELRACRRRQQIPWDRTGVAAILKAPDEFGLFEMRALVAACERRLRSRAMSVEQAFHAFNSSRTGALNASELFSGLLWLDMQVEVPQVHQLLRTFDTNGNGLLSCDEFVAAFARDASLQFKAEAQPLAAPIGDTVIPLHRIPELYHAPAPDGQSFALLPSPPQVKMLDFAATMQPCTAFQLVVRRHRSSQGINSVLSIWQPVLANPLTDVARVLVPIGHYAKKGFAPPQGESGYQLLELCDASCIGLLRDRKRRLHAALEQLLPLPCRYRVIWSAKGTDPFTIWMPVPPNQGFVALSAVASATTSAQPPPLDATRCVPSKWVQVSRTRAKLVWDDVDVSAWSGSHGLLHGMKGHQLPSRLQELKQGDLTEQV